MGKATTTQGVLFKGLSKKPVAVPFDQDPTHGGQQLTFFNTTYDSWCYLPVAGFLTFDDEPQQYLFCYVLRPGNAPAKQGCLGILKRLLPRLRSAFPGATIRVRLDAGFSGPELYEFFEAQRLEYLVCMGKNPVLAGLAEPLMSRARRLIIRAGIAIHAGRPARDNPGFLITNIKGWPKAIYERIYCARCDAENRRLDRAFQPQDRPAPAGFNRLRG